MSPRGRLLLDEMYSPAIADLLGKRGIDAVAVCGHEPLEGQPDERVLQVATDDNRCLVTENVRDFERIRATRTELGEGIAGMLYVSPKRFPRTPMAVHGIADALAKIVDNGRVPVAGGVDWLT